MVLFYGILFGIILLGIVVISIKDGLKEEDANKRKSTFRHFLIYSISLLPFALVIAFLRRENSEFLPLGIVGATFVYLLAIYISSIIPKTKKGFVIGVIVFTLLMLFIPIDKYVDPMHEHIYTKTPDKGIVLTSPRGGERIVHNTYYFNIYGIPFLKIQKEHN